MVSSKAVRAVILAVGSELLATDRLDSNSLLLTAILERHGVELVRKGVVGDDESAIEREVRRAFEDAELVLVGGGLGPTADDVTREGCAHALGRKLREDAATREAIARRFAAMGREPSANNWKQAQLLDGATALPNPRGTAPGQRLEVGGGALFLFPGVPYELALLAERDLDPWLAARAGGVARERRTLRVALRPESEVDQQLEPAYVEFGREWITVLAAPGEVRIRLTAAGAADARAGRLAEMATRVRELLGEAVYGEGEDQSLERVVGEELAASGRTIATAESCTGGLLAERLTRMPGSSRYFPGGVVTYSNAEKTRQLGVPADLIAAHGAVSEEVARAMAEGVRDRLGADFGIAITGIAGPDGGSEAKPVGTVHVAVAGPAESIGHRHLRLPGDRERIRWQASQAALEMVRRRLLELAAREGR